MPLSRLSKANIKRARRIIARSTKYKHLGTKRKHLLAFRVAWDIQKGHIKATGHR